MKISIITVCYNAEKTIRRTMDSVLKLNFDASMEIEHIIVDGASKDFTYDIVKEYEHTYAEKGIAYVHQSEPDDSLYDAMNKGAKLATGEYLIYMNADDEFASQESIFAIPWNELKENDVIYGDTIICDKNGESIRKSLPVETITKHLPFIPQSAFIRSTVQREFLFDDQYKITADYDSFLRMYLAGKKFCKINQTISKFYWGGIEPGWLENL